MGELIVGTRGSALALAQTGLVCDALTRTHPELRIRVERITTTGDERRDVPLAELGRGAFVSEIEWALRQRRIHFAVHSAKDMPSTLPDDLVIAAYLPRADARDVVVSPFGTLRDLPTGARVGTSSPRRACLLHAIRPDVRAVDVRGNVDTRLRKLRAGEFDALILAAAGLIRLGRAGEITEWLDPATMIPSVGQGALAVEARADDEQTIALLRRLDDPDTRMEATAERAFLAELGAGCRAAAGAHAMLRGGDLHLSAFIGGTDGRHVRTSDIGPASESLAAQLGERVARELLRGGGAEFLARPDSSLVGTRVALTRQESQSRELAALLRANGAEPVSCPTIEIAPPEDLDALDRDIQGLATAEWIVFTSANAVEPVVESMRRLGLMLPARVRVAAIGGATASAAVAGLGRVDFVPSRATAETLGRELPVDPDDVVLLPLGNLAGETLREVLVARGVEVRVATVYRTVPGLGALRLADLVRDAQIEAIVFTSPSTIRFAPDAVAGMRARGANAPAVVCVGPTTAAAAREAGLLSVTEARTQSLGGIVEALERALSADRPRQLATR